MPKPYPKEFREDVVAVARRQEDGVTIKQIATDFGISETCLQNWLRQADVEDGYRPGATATRSSSPFPARRGQQASPTRVRSVDLTLVDDELATLAGLWRPA